MEVAEFKEYRDKALFDGNKYVSMGRDGYKCTECEMSDEEHIKEFGRSLVTHHIDGSGRTETPNNSLDNLLTLCIKCHARTHQTMRTERLKESPITHCKYGHSLTEENAIYVYPDGKKHECNKCRKIRRKNFKGKETDGK